MDTDFAVSELSSMPIVAFWKSLKMYISVDGHTVIKELLGRREEPVVWAWSHTAIHLSLHSSNKCHLYTEATHVSFLADIIDACFSGYMYWLIATVNVLRVRSNNKSWWWLSDALNSQGPWKYGRIISIGLIELPFHSVLDLSRRQCSKNVLVLYICSVNMPLTAPFPENNPSLPYILPNKRRWWNGGKKSKRFNMAPCRLLWIIITVQLLPRSCAGWSSLICPWPCPLGEELFLRGGQFRSTRGASSPWSELFPVLFPLCHPKRLMSLFWFLSSSKSNFRDR